MNDHQHQLRDIRTIRSPMWARILTFYLCPADRFLSRGTEAEEVDPPRSKSSNAFFGHYSDPPQNGGRGAQGRKPIRGWVARFPKLTEVPSPAGIFVMLDGNIPTGSTTVYFLYSPEPGSSWLNSDLAASYHNGAAGFSFADGHSEIHKWLDRERRQK